MTTKHRNILLWNVKISSDEDATRQARQSCQHWFNSNWPCPWAGEMGWISSSWAVGRHWHILGDPARIIYLICYFSFFLPFPLKVLLENYLKVVVFTLGQQDRRGAEPSDPPYLRARYEHGQWPAGWTPVAHSLHSPGKREVSCVGGYAGKADLSLPRQIQIHTHRRNN